MLFSYIKNLNEDISYKFMEQDIMNNLENACHYNEIPLDIQMKMINKDPYSIRYIQNLNSNVAKKAVKKDYRLLHSYILQFGPDFDILFYVKQLDPKYFDNYIETTRSVPEEIINKINKLYNEFHDAIDAYEDAEIINFHQ